MCAGITLYEPLRVHGATKGSVVGIVGMGGLGIMGVKLGNLMGATVTAISRGRKKEAMAKENGATSFIDSKVKAEMDANAGTFDLILNTIPIDHDISPYWKLLKPKTGKIVVIGLTPMWIAAAQLPKLAAWGGIYSTLIGGVAHTQEVIDICAKAKIVPKIKLVPVEELNNVMALLDKSNDSGVRYVLDIKKSLNDTAASRCSAPAPELHPCESMKLTNVVKSICTLSIYAAKRNPIVAGVVVTAVVGIFYQSFRYFY